MQQSCTRLATEWKEKVHYLILVCVELEAGLPNREGPKPGEIGGGRSVGTFFGLGVTAAGVTRSGLADRSERSGQ